MGFAFLRLVGLSDLGSLGGPDHTGGFPRTSLAVGETIVATFQGVEGIRHSPGFWVAVEYQDLAGKNWESRFKVLEKPDRTLVVTDSLSTRRSGTLTPATSEA